MQSDNKKVPKLTFSVADIPLGIALEEYFLLASSLKVDGLELVVGWKTRFQMRKVARLSKRYNIPILSVHQPAWSVAGFFNDAGAFKFAQKFNSVFVAHPLVNTHINSPKSKAYYKWLVEMGKKYDLKILIENMTNIYQLMPLLHYVSKTHHDSATDLEYFDTVCKKYGFGFTLDISHLMAAVPQDAKGFKELLPFMQNIHLSDFTVKKEHMGLGDGLLNYESFLNYLKDIKYDGLINLELCPRVLNAREKYYKDIAKSVKIVREYFK
jgi:sugar phosphate isomerase/epimerase